MGSERELHEVGRVARMFDVSTVNKVIGKQVRESNLIHKGEDLGKGEAEESTASVQPCSFSGLEPIVLNRLQSFADLCCVDVERFLYVYSQDFGGLLPALGETKGSCLYSQGAEVLRLLSSYPPSLTPYKETNEHQLCNRVLTP